jgi:DNA polymerase IV
MTDRIERIVLHVDMDAFYASIEQRDHPELKDKPLVVGGSSERGVVAAASYQARQFGVRSAMPIKEALRRCPHLVIVTPRPSLYQAVSEQIFDVFYRYTPDVEGLSLDEAFLDFTHCQRLWPNPLKAAAAIKADIFNATQLTASIGIASNKFLAKLASDWLKPDGLFSFKQVNVEELIFPLPIEKLYGIGIKTAPLLKARGIHTFGDLANARALQLRDVLGSNTEIMIARARGLDDRPVEPFRDAKQISSEKTFAVDLKNDRQIRAQLLQLADQVSHRLRDDSLFCRRVILKIRRGDFKTFTRSTTFDHASNDRSAIASTSLQLWETFRDEQPDSSIRLLGVGVGDFSQETQQDLFSNQPLPSLEGTTNSPASNLTGTLDEIQRRFGKNALLRASAVKRPLGDER